jgi:PAS domain S-box-containing protein
MIDGTLFLLPIIATGLTTVLMGILIWRNSHLPVKTPFLLLMALVSTLSFEYLMEMINVDLGAKMFWNHFEYITFVGTAPAFLYFVTEYLGWRNFWTKRRVVPILLIPILSLIMEWTNEYHHLFYSWVGLKVQDPFIMFYPQYGPWFWVHAIYTFSLFSVGILVLLRAYLDTPRLHRKQMGIILLAILIPVSGNIASLLGFDLLPIAYFLNIGLLISALLIFLGTFRFELFDVIPLVLTRVLENMNDGVVVLDAKGRFAHINRSGEKILGSSAKELLGKHQSQRFIFLEGIDLRLPHRLNGIVGLSQSGHSKGEYEVLLTPLSDARGIFNGCLIMIRDVTEERKTKEALRTANEKLNLLSNITRHDVLNQLVALRGYTELLKVKMAGRDEEKYLNGILSASMSIEHQMQFTRDYQSIGVGAPDWQRVETVVQRAKITSPVGLLEVVIDLDDLEIFADLMLEKVFFNLMDNTMKHGGKVSRVRISYHLDADQCVITYEDNGRGIPPERKESIYELRGGSRGGVGLFVCHQILAITNITVVETGEPGRGARFEIRVPKGCWRLGEKLEEEGEHVLLASTT